MKWERYFEISMVVGRLGLYIIKFFFRGTYQTRFDLTGRLERRYNFRIRVGDCKRFREHTT